uniref:Uncharacterized protein n=1 Tax=Cynoglossus semilaevis TaxID=244447 RepID=A0A3P8WAI2_CYNSE
MCVHYFFFKFKNTFFFRPIEGLLKTPVSQVACGSSHSVVLTKDGQVYTWGEDSRGQLGLGNRRTAGTWSPQHLTSLSALPLVDVAAGGDQSFVVSVSGAVLGWGRNQCGQLGLGDTKGFWGSFYP